MTIADPLSRRPDYEEKVENDNRNKILLKKEYFAIKAISSFHEFFINDDKLIEEIKSAIDKDPFSSNYDQLVQTGPRQIGKDLKD